HHTCYGINMGPRTSDIELKHLADILVNIKAGAYSFEMANPRHEHEWRVWEAVKLPDDKVLIPGCVTHASVIVEHPDLVAERIVRLAKIVGRERVIAGTDCGFASTLVPGQRPEIEPEIVWAKFKSLVEGARTATRALWGEAWRRQNQCPRRLRYSGYSSRLLVDWPWPQRCLPQIGASGRRRSPRHP